MFIGKLINLQLLEVAWAYCVLSSGVWHLKSGCEEASYMLKAKQAFSW